MILDRVCLEREIGESLIRRSCEVLPVADSQAPNPLRTTVDALLVPDSHKAIVMGEARQWLNDHWRT